VNSLGHTLATARLLVMCGSGGVGKTTTSAALALTAALQGRRVGVLTIDPAQRLLQALGLHGTQHPANEPLEVLPRLNALLPETPAGGSLHALMLDAQSAAVAMIERLLPDPSVRDRVLGNRIYRAFLPALAASPDYMALELISKLQREGQFDLLVLDTPPMHNALEFLHAGGTLSGFLNDKVLKWFAMVPRPGQKSARFSLLQTGASMAMSVLGRLFGQDVLPDIAEFFLSFQDVLPKLNEAAAATDRLLRAPGTHFAIVTAPGETALREARHLHGELAQAGVPFAGFVCNRVLTVPAEVHQIRRDDPHGDHLRERLMAGGQAPVAAQLVQAAQWLDQLAEADAGHVATLRQLVGSRGFVAVAPLQPGDLHTLADLAAHGRRLTTVA
jgi:anion-transporting  ArsA/GET3 family ATPase